MLDKLSFTIDKMPDKDYLSSHGSITEAKRGQLYKYMSILPDYNVAVFYLPHKFDPITNFRIPAAKIDLNPKSFENFDSMLVYLSFIIREIYERPEMCNITRLDAAADIEDLTMELLLASLHVQKITLSTFTIIKRTIYAGSDPKFRIYDKIKELKYKMSKGYTPTEYEKALLASEKLITRFEVQKKALKMSLKDLPENAIQIVSYFDGLDFFNFDENTFTAIMQNVYRLIPSKYRNQLEQYKDNTLVEKIKERCTAGIQKWFNSEEPF